MTRYFARSAQLPLLVWSHSDGRSLRVYPDRKVLDLSTRPNCSRVVLWRDEVYKLSDGAWLEPPVGDGWIPEWPDMERRGAA